MVVSSSHLQKLLGTILRSAFLFLESDLHQFSAMWNWSCLFPLLHSHNQAISTFAFACLSRLLGLSEVILDRQAAFHRSILQEYALLVHAFLILEVSGVVLDDTIPSHGTT